MQQTVTDILTGLCLFTYYVSGNSFRELGWVQKFWVGLSFENCMIHVQLTVTSASASIRIPRRYINAFIVTIIIIQVK